MTLSSSHYVLLLAVVYSMLLNTTAFQSSFSGTSCSNSKFHGKGCKLMMQSSDGSSDPLLLRAARGENVERTPVWMMRQAGRHMASYRELCKKYKTFRERSEIAEVATEIRYVFFGFAQNGFS